MYTIEGIMKKQPCVPNTTTLALAMHKDSQTISKVKPKIRIIHIFAPKIFKTDTANFRELVQRLTGKPKEDSCTKKKARHPRKGVQSMFYKNSVTKKMDLRSRFHPSVFSERIKVEEEIWSGVNSGGCFLGGLTGLDVDALMQDLNGFPIKNEEEIRGRANSEDLDEFMQELNGFSVKGEEEKWSGANSGGGFADLDSITKELNGFGNGEEEERWGGETSDGGFLGGSADVDVYGFMQGLNRWPLVVALGGSHMDAACLWRE